MSRRQPLTRTAGIVAVAAATALAIGGCGRAVSIEDNLLGQAPVSCAQVVVALPTEVAGQPQRAVDEAEANSVAAWGDPPVVLTCGVPEPAAYEPTSTLADVSGIAWLPEPLENGTMFTTVGRVPRVQVAIPSWVQSPSSALAELAPSLLTATQQEPAPDRTAQ